MKSANELVQEIAENTTAQTDAIRQGDAKAGNKHANKRIRAVRALFAMGDAGREALVPLMYHSNADVRSMAAAYLLRYRHVEARRVLEKVAAGRGLIAFEASEALKRWDEGTWQLDPE